MSYASQGIIVFPYKKDLPDDSDLLILIKKTGFADIWINGTHYYWDERTDKSKLLNSALILGFNGGKKEEEKKKKKGKIIITKK